MNLIENRISAWWSTNDLRDYLEVIEKLIFKWLGDMSHDSMVNSISKVSPEVAEIIQLLQIMWLLWVPEIKSLISQIDISSWWYTIKTSHPSIVKGKLWSVNQVSTQKWVWVQVSKSGNVYKRNFDTDVHKLLA